MARVLPYSLAGIRIGGLMIWLVILVSLALAAYLWQRIDEAEKAAHAKATPAAAPKGSRESARSGDH